MISWASQHTKHRQFSWKSPQKTSVNDPYTRVKIFYDVVFILELYDHIFVDCYDDFRA